MCAFLLILTAPAGWVQQADPARALRPPPAVALNSVAVAPQTLDTKVWLLLNPGILTKLDGAVHNLYNFQFDKADKQLR